MIIEFFVFGTLLFWLLLLAEFGLMTVCVARHNGWLASLTIIASLVSIQLLSDVNLLEYIRHDPIILLIGVLVYLFAGIVWIFPRWLLFCKDHCRNWRELKADFLEQKGVEVMTTDIEKDWQDYFIHHNRYKDETVQFRPKPRDNKEKIILWGAYWPFSFVWTILDDPLMRFFRYVYDEIVDVLQRISDNVFKEETK